MGRATSEHSNLMRLIRLQAADMGHTLFPNQRYKGQIVKRGKVLDARADCGLCDGALDLIGYTNRGRFLAIDAKIGDDRPRTDQIGFANAVKASGGIAGFAWSVQDFIDIMTEQDI
jgi:hypothetical protein